MAIAYAIALLKPSLRNRVEFVDAHHIEHWSAGGDKLFCLSRRHLFTGTNDLILYIPHHMPKRQQRHRYKLHVLYREWIAYDRQ